MSLIQDVSPLCWANPLCCRPAATSPCWLCTAQAAGHHCLCPFSGHYLPLFHWKPTKSLFLFCDWQSLIKEIAMLSMLPIFNKLTYLKCTLFFGNGWEVQNCPQCKNSKKKKYGVLELGKSVQYSWICHNENILTLIIAKLRCCHIDCQGFIMSCFCGFVLEYFLLNV